MAPVSIAQNRGTIKDGQIKGGQGGQGGQELTNKDA